MKKLLSLPSIVMATFIMCSCQSQTSEPAAAVASATTTEPGGQASVIDDESAKDVVKVAAGSADHTTLVAALKQAELINALSNAGPFTVFAPVNQAFEKLPKGTVENLMKPENKEKLQDILQYHVFVGSLSTDMMQDGQVLNEVNGGNISISKKGDKVMINNSATIITSIRASNGIIHVIDAVLLPPSK